MVTNMTQQAAWLIDEPDPRSSLIYLFRCKYEIFLF